MNLSHHRSRWRKAVPKDLLMFLLPNKIKKKKRKPLRTSKRAKQTITCSDKDSRSTENEEETNTGKVSAMKLQKKEDGEFTVRSIVFIV